MFIYGSGERGKKLTDENKKKIIIFLLFGLPVFFLFKNGFSPGKMLFGLDTFTLFHPFSLFIKDSIARYGQLPLWMPSIFMGIPLFDSANVIFFYPTNLVFTLLPVPLHATYVLDALIHLFLAAFGMKLFLSRLGMRAEAALFGGFTFMLSGMLISYIYTGHWHDIKAISLVPFVFYFILRGAEENKLFHFLSAGLFMGLQILAIGMQVMLYTFAGAGIFFLYMVFAENNPDTGAKKKIWMYTALCAAAVIGFSALQFLPSLSYMSHSWRKVFTYGDFTMMSFPPVEMLTFIMPQLFGLSEASYWGPSKAKAVTFYLGIIPVLLAPFAFTGGPLRKKMIFFMILGFLFALFSFGGYTPVYRILYHIPVLNKLRDPGRFLTVFSFLMTVVSAAGLNNILNSERSSVLKDSIIYKYFINILKIAGPAAGLILLVSMSKAAVRSFIRDSYEMIRSEVAAENLVENGARMITNDAVFLFMCAACFFALVYLWLKNRIKGAAVFVILLAAVQFADMYRIDKKFISYKSMEEIAEKTNPVISELNRDESVYRVMDLNFLWFPNKSIYYGKEFFLGYHGIVPYYFFNILASEAFLSINVMRAFNVKYYMDTAERAGPGIEKILSGRINLYRDNHAKERVYIAAKVKKFDNDEDVIKHLKSKEFLPDEAAVAGNVFPPVPGGQKASEAEIVKYTPNRIEIQAETEKEAVLVISNMYYNKWKAKINGKKAKVYRVNYAAMGVVIPEGESRVELFFDPMLMIISLLLTAAAFIMYLAVYLREMKRKG